MVHGMKVIADPRCTQDQRSESATLVDCVQQAKCDVRTWRLNCQSFDTKQLQQMTFSDTCSLLLGKLFT
jgi:hypothetical protein